VVSVIVRRLRPENLADDVVWEWTGTEKMIVIANNILTENLHMEYSSFKKQLLYSSRNAALGDSLVARRAGTQLAASATTMSSAPVET